MTKKRPIKIIKKETLAEEILDCLNQLDRSQDQEERLNLIDHIHSSLIAILNEEKPRLLNPSNREGLVQIVEELKQILLDSVEPNTKPVTNIRWNTRVHLQFLLQHSAEKPNASLYLN
jgi:hypothetical protein